MSWTPDQVLSLAPDEKAAKAGQSQASPSRWTGTGRSDRALWGLCQGSGKKPYQTTVDLTEPAFKCSCPSRKFPCKHGLGLMLLLAQNAATLPPGEPPGWAAEWIAARDERADRRDVRRQAEGPADPEKAAAEAAKRVGRREQRIRDGLGELRLWLDDLLRQGLAHAETRAYGDFQQMAARLVDAQAPGLARRVTEMAHAIGSSARWPERMLEHAALLSLLCDSYLRHEALPEELSAEVRAQIGWTLTHDDVLAAGARVSDQWSVVGQSAAEDDRLRVRRTWLHGGGTGRYALLLDFAHATQNLPPAPAPGQLLDADLVFYPAGHPSRAVVADQRAAGTARRPPAASVAELHDQRAAALAANPWIDRMPVTANATAVQDGDRWWLADDQRDAIPLQADPATSLTVAALSGGRPAPVFCEWHRDGVVPLSVWADDRLALL